MRPEQAPLQANGRPDENNTELAARNGGHTELELGRAANGNIGGRLEGDDIEAPVHKEADGKQQAAASPVPVASRGLSTAGTPPVFLRFSFSVLLCRSCFGGAMTSSRPLQARCPRPQAV